jgi:tetratricopeptide (TPR) repeat protein
MADLPRLFYNSLMRFWAAACIYALFTSPASAADPRWIRIQSPNFELYSTASERSARETLEEFEQVRAFFLNTLPTKDQKPLPVRIVTFNSVKEYEPYRFNEFATAYYYPGAERDTIVMSHGGSETFPTAIHEYVHLVIQHAGVKPPPWLNEGLAEFYSTLRPLGGKIIVGDIIPNRLAALRADNWVPLSVILAVDQNSPYYNEKNKAGSFYNEGWALTHMLSLSDEYRPKWKEFAAAVIKGRDAAEALSEIYGKPLAAIDQDLQYYIRGTRFLAGTFDARLEKVNQTFPAEPAPMFDVKLMLLDLSERSGKEQETEAQIEKLSAEQPSRPEPYAQLGYLAWRRSGTGEAQKQFAKAFELGGRGTRMLWDYGRMIESSRPEEAVKVLNELTALEPARRDVKIELAAALLNAKRPEDSVSTLLALGGCTPEEAPRCIGVATYAYLKLNDRVKAAATAELYQKYAKTPEDQRRAQEVLDYLKKPAGPVTITERVQTGAQPIDDDPGRPTLSRRSTSGTTDTPATLSTRAAPLSASGAFVEFVCGDTAKVVIETSGGKQTFVIQDPNAIAITGRETGTAELSCGAQKRVPVRVDYSSDGIVLAIHFDP